MSAFAAHMEALARFSVELDFAFRLHALFHTDLKRNFKNEIITFYRTSFKG